MGMEKSMSTKELGSRYATFILGLFFIAVGINFTVKSNLGISPISSVPYVISVAFEQISFGSATFTLNMVFLLGQIILAGKKFKLIQLVQIPLSLVFGYFVNLTGSLLVFINAENYVFRFICLLIGCAFIAAGVSLSVIANVVMNSAEAFLKIVVDKRNGNFGNNKVILDVSLVLISTFLSWILLNRIVGLGIGTFVSAILIGRLVKIIISKLGFLNDILTDK